MVPCTCDQSSGVFVTGIKPVKLSSLWCFVHMIRVGSVCDMSSQLNYSSLWCFVHMTRVEGGGGVTCIKPVNYLVCGVVYT